MSHANTTLLTPEETVQYGPSDDHLSGSKLQLYIQSQEEHWFNTRFGWEFYEKLRADRYEYRLRGTGDAADDGNGNRSYYYADPQRIDIITGDFVLSDDVVYKSILDVTTAGIGVENIDYYQRADRFKSDCLQQLWSSYLRVILATAVVRASVMPRTFKDTQRGAVKQYEEGKSKSLSAAEVSALKSEHLGDIETQIANMERHIKRDTAGCFALYGKLEADDCGCDEDTTNGLLTNPSGAGQRLKNYGFSL